MNPSDENDVELRIAEVVARWMQLPAVRRWDAAVVSELIAQHPELAPGLEECLQGLRRIEAVATLSTGDSDAAVVTSEAELPQIPDFQITGELGRGGMGVVYEARQLSLNRVVALKVLPMGRVDRGAVERFVREANTVAGMQHEGIVPVFAVGVHEGLHWFAMQRIEGMPLSQWFAHRKVASRQQAIEEVVRVGIEAAAALDHAHQRGVIHRDVKPGNLLVDSNHKVWLTDFGLARRDVDVTATATGAMLGTPRYMSPEQISHAQHLIDARTDVYSLGATLYEMATGRPPFATESPLQLLNHIQQDEPPAPRQLDGSIPRPLELVILKCLDKDPDRRYATAGELGEDLRAIRDDRPINAKGLPLWVRMERWGKRHQQPLHTAVSAIVLTVAIMGAAFVLWQQTQQMRQGQVRINTPGGLYVASIHPQQPTAEAKAGGAANQAVLVTTPMQAPMPLAAGNYTVRLEGDGNVSQVSQVSVAAGDTAELQYVDRRPPPPQIDIHGKLARSWSGGALAVLGQEALQVFEPGGVLRFSLPLEALAPEEIDTSVEAETDAGNKPAKPPRDRGDPLSFAFQREQVFQGDFDVSHPGFARIARLVPLSLDLDDDQHPDLLVTAARHAAISAVSSSGTVLWKRRLPMGFEANVPTSRFPFRNMPVEAIVGVQPVADLNGDGTADLLINAAVFDPSGFSRPQLFTLSGRDGRSIAVTDLPTVDMRQAGPWPWPGVLRHNRGFNSSQRRSRYLVGYFDQIRSFGQTHDLHNMQWSGNSASSALYVLPTPQLVGEVAATAIKQSIHFIDVATGEAAGPAIPLSEPICRGPLKVQLADGQWGVVVVTGKPSNSYSVCQLSLCVPHENQPRWTVPQSMNAYELVAGAAESSFPLVVDLDQDGESEVITTTNADAPFASSVLECFEATTGKRLWVSPQLIAFAKLADKAVAVGDVDQDGIGDLAVLGIAERPAPQGGPRGILLVVDFVSGRTGQRLGFREEAFATAIDGVVEIDEVHFQGTHLSCSIVYNAVNELELSSLSFTIDLSSHRPATVARGLTLLPGDDSTIAGPAGRWYRRRSGPYAANADHAVWVPRPYRSFRMPATVLANAWTTAQGQPRVLLQDNGVARVVDPLSGETQWEHQAFEQPSRTHVLPAADGEIELLWEDDQHRAAFHNSLNGRLKFQLESPPNRGIHFLDFDQQAPQRFVYALVDADPTPAQQMSSRVPLGYRLLKIDRQQRTVVWSQPMLSWLDVRRPHLQPSRVLQVDVNQDGMLDVIVAHNNKDEVFVQALNGRDGKRMWGTPLELVPSEQLWPWNIRWPQMELVSSRQGRFLLVVDAVANDDQAVQFKCFDIHNGRLLSTIQQPLRQSLRHSTSAGDLQWRVLTPGSNDGLVGLSMVDKTTGHVFVVLQVNPQGQLAVQHRFPTGNRTMTADVDYDGTLDRISIKGEEVTIYAGTSDQPLTSFTLPDSLIIRRIEQAGNQSYLVGHDGDMHCWIELPSGNIAVETHQGFQALTIHHTEYPRLLPHAEGTLLIGTTPEGPLCIELPWNRQKKEALPAAFAMQRPETDSRYLRPIRALGPYRYKSLADVLWLGVLTFLALWLPVVYGVRAIWRRQWSLRALLLAPLLTMLAIYGWRALATLHRGQIGTNVLLGTLVTAAIWSVGYLIVHKHWRPLAMVTAVSALLATLLMFATEQSMVARSPGLIGYWTLPNWLAAVLTTASFLLGIVGVLALRQDMQNRRRKLRWLR
ncbi:serine/threonine protein kinase [Roseimaritima ulvae]|uniref:non-specific serine/threonine protein kinase n=1 Tax=Roseimaritima ulvae TaxID=980254 RepID=A0A5B9QNX7_9BACT|nr:serine/threonine-protein kinase [Roseimaritima ulvae]QEG39195.1 Serine/threonine-protein kinase PrkC [Roseimaritima ulvae]